MGGGWPTFGGACAPGPNVEPPLLMSGTQLYLPIVDTIDQLKMRFPQEMFAISDGKIDSVGRIDLANYRFG